MHIIMSGHSAAEPAALKCPLCNSAQAEQEYKHSAKQTVRKCGFSKVQGTVWKEKARI
jgi:hypothetical protein